MRLIQGETYVIFKYVCKVPHRGYQTYQRENTYLYP